MKKANTNDGPAELCHKQLNVEKMQRNCHQEAQRGAHRTIGKTQEEKNLPVCWTETVRANVLPPDMKQKHTEGGKM